MPQRSESNPSDLFRASTELLILALLADGRQYGYAIQKQLKQWVGQTVPASALYPLLHRLESSGMVEVTIDASSARQRKWYTLTDAGRARFRKSAADWQGTIARLQALVLPAVRRVATQR